VSGQLSFLSLWCTLIEYWPLWLGVTAGCVHLCRVEGNTLWSDIRQAKPYSSETTW